MRGRSIVEFIAAALVVTLSCPAIAALDGEQEIVFDGYQRGIHVYELEVTRKGGQMQYESRRKDLRSNAWEPAVQASSAELTEDDARVTLAGPLRAFPRLLPALSAVNWNAVQSASVAGSDSVYVRHRKLERTIAGDTVAADY